MKNKILIISILILFLVVGLIGYYFLKSKADKPVNAEPSVNEVNDELEYVDIINNKATGKVKINDITISNISINDSGKKQLFFEISSKGTDLNALTLTVILLNSDKLDSANQKKIKLSGSSINEKEKNKKTIIMDIDNIYNEPKQIKFKIE